jgi:hypothetical protein
MRIPGLAPPLADKLAKMLPMLSSDRDGEVLATVRAIGRTLRAGGIDWHTLAKAIIPPEQSEIAIAADDFATMATVCLTAGIFTGRDLDFLQNVRRRVGIGLDPTEAQARWLRGLYLRATA